MVDAFSTNFSLDGFGFDLGRCEGKRDAAAQENSSDEMHFFVRKLGVALA